MYSLPIVCSRGNFTKYIYIMSEWDKKLPYIYIVSFTSIVAIITS